MSHIKTLVERTRPLDTGLKSATLVAIYEYGCMDTTSIVDLFAEINGFGSDEFNYRKKSEGIRAILDQFSDESIITIQDRGKAKPGFSRYLVEEVESDHVQEVRQIAYQTIAVCSMLDFAANKFWQVRGGSYSTDEKQAVQGIQLSTFYGLTREQLDTERIVNQSENPILRSRFAQQLGIGYHDASNYLNKFVKMGLVEKSQPLGKNNAYGAHPNGCTYSLTNQAKTLMEELFFPSLAKTITPQVEENIPQTKSEDLTNIVQLHYESFKNQHS